MDPLTLLAGYWVFRGLEALIRANERERMLERGPPPREVPVAAIAPPILHTPTVRGRSMREPTGARYADAKSLFGAEYVSFTRLDTYAKCPHKFKLTYLEGFRQEERDASKQARSGNDFHAACDQLFKRYLNQPLGKAMEDSAVTRDERIRQVIQVAPPDSVILASELELRFRARGREFLGYVDLAVEHPDSTVGLIDFKTGYTRAQYSPDSLQMDVYSIPELLLRPERSVHLAFVLVDADRSVKWTNGPENRNQVIERVRNRVVQVERDTEFVPAPSGLCQYCHVRELCEAGGQESVYKQFARRTNP